MRAWPSQNLLCTPGFLDVLRVLVHLQQHVVALAELVNLGHALNERVELLRDDVLVEALLHALLIVDEELPCEIGQYLRSRLQQLHVPLEETRVFLPTRTRSPSTLCRRSSGPCSPCRGTWPSPYLQHAKARAPFFWRLPHRLRRLCACWVSHPVEFPLPRRYLPSHLSLPSP